MGLKAWHRQAVRRPACQSVIPANAGIHLTPAWIPAFAGMTAW
jgi:hypothetical protein